MADVDDLQTNPFFNHLQAGNALEQAALHQYVICVPLAASLGPKPMIDKEMILSHVLIPTEQKGVYATAGPTKRLVTITGIF